MAERIERTYNVPLRREFIKVPQYRRTPRAVRALKAFLQKHMKSPNVTLGKYLNLELWKNGIKNPPHHIKVNVIKEGDKVLAELFGKKIETEKKKETKAEEAKESNKE